MRTRHARPHLMLLGTFRMASRFLTVPLMLSSLWGSNSVAYAEPGKIDIEAAEMVADLIGGPVLAIDGMEVGLVVDVAFDDELQPQSLRMTTSAALGLGARTLEVPKDAFMPVQGAVILRVSAEEVALLPEATEK
jgi:hypothetical protein